MQCKNVCYIVVEKFSHKWEKKAGYIPFAQNIVYYFLYTNIFYKKMN